MKTYTGLIGRDFPLPENGIFVFGSNTQGRHGKGTALIARRNYRAVYGQAKGRQGRCYAIVTKDLTKTVHPSISEEQIQEQILELYDYATKNPELDFYIAYTANGVNLNAYSSQEMADMFGIEEIPENIIFEDEFSKLI